MVKSELFADAKGEYHLNLLWIAGRPYILAPLELRVRLIKKGARKYPYFYIPVPIGIAMAFLDVIAPDYINKLRDHPEELSGLPLTVALTRAPWYHGIDMTGLTEGLSKRALREVKALHLDTPPADRPELVAILATRKEIEELGLDPEEPITLDDLKRVLEERTSRRPKTAVSRG